MHIPASFQETDRAYIRRFIEDHGFATLINTNDDRPVGTHLLLDLKEKPDSSFVLSGHLAKANPQWRTFAMGKEVLAVFLGPHAYVSARWYSVTSVPTWNYVSVHAYGVPRIITDPVELFALLKRLVDRQENKISGGVKYTVESLPGDDLEKMMSAVVGLEIEVTRIEAAVKLSQNRSRKDYRNVVRKLKASGDQTSMEVAREMESRENRAFPKEMH